jgi:predicted MFS family arabinose efflux permease
VLAGFAAQQRRLGRRGGAPLLEPGLLRDRAFNAGMFTQLVFWSGQASFFLLLAVYLQMGRGLYALQAGLVFTILAAAYLVASMRAPALAKRHGRGLVAAGGLALAAGHALLLGAVADGGVDGSIALMLPGLVLVGTGMGLCITPLNAIVLANVAPQSAGSAAGVMSTVQQVGNALGTALSGVIFFGALDGGYAHAFELGVGQLALLGVVVAAVTRVLPR